MTYMAEAVPLSTALSVERVAVIIRDILSDGLVAVLKGFAIERRLLGHIERKTNKQSVKSHLYISNLSPNVLESHHLSSKYLLCRRLDPLWCQKIQSSQLFHFC